MSSGDAYVVCDEAYWWCRCVLLKGHDPADVHVCDDGCGGSWQPDPTTPGGVRVLAFPSGVPVGRASVSAGNPYAAGGP